MAQQRTLHDLFLDNLRDIYHAEGQLLKALPKMAKAATAPPLREGFELHLEETEQQRERLERVFEAIDARAKGKTCAAMEGLVEEGKEWMSEDATPEVMDAGLIACAQKVEHYEIAAYGCLVTWAQQLDLSDDAVALLKQNLAEEKETDEKLTRLAENTINAQAAAGR
jgi:ferritin-like metal-binding protein YciE